MDRTLNPVKRGNKARRARNWRAWLALMGGDACRYCGHPASDHLSSSGQPHYYAPADADVKGGQLYQHTLADGTDILVKRVRVSNAAELVTCYCVRCAAAKDTRQVLCFQRTLAVGEVVGV